MGQQITELEQGNSLRVDGANNSFLVVETYNSGIDSITWPTSEDATVMLTAAQELIEYEDPWVKIVDDCGGVTSLRGIAQCLNRWERLFGEKHVVTIVDPTIKYELIWQAGLGEGEPDEVGIIGEFPDYLGVARQLIQKTSPQLFEDLPDDLATQIDLAFDR